MPKIAYTQINFQSKSIDLIQKCNEVLAEYAAAGYDVTLRQLYYQLVSQDLIPNNQKQYDRLGSLVNDARLAGLMAYFKPFEIEKIEEANLETTGKILADLKANRMI